MSYHIDVYIWKRNSDGDLELVNNSDGTADTPATLWSAMHSVITEVADELKIDKSYEC